MKKAFLGVFYLITLLFVFGCQGATTTTTRVTTTNNLDYSDFPELILTDPLTQMNRPELDYYLYFYGPTCEHCFDIKGELLAIIQYLTIDKIYIIEADSREDLAAEMTFDQSPSLVHIVIHEV
jgi:hypothetical protein